MHVFGKKQDTPIPPPPAAETAPPPPAPAPTSASPDARTLNYGPDAALETREFAAARDQVVATLVDRIDFRALETLQESLKRARITSTIDAFLRNELNVPLTANQQELLRKQVLDDLLGFGPIEVLLKDPDINDIMINGSKQIYVEKKGKVYLSDVKFNTERHLLNVIQKIVSLVGRRVDESSPMVDARMPDGSRFNAIIPPLALDGCLVSIRKFKRSRMNLSDYVGYNSMSKAMSDFLEICGASRLNVIVSGGTGSGKTTLLNALSGHIDHGERVITIEDAAELQLQQPHVLRLETRPANIEGAGEVSQRHLVKNALRMRPDRIILGEMRGEEVIDVLSAMNTGHDGSMATIHANNPRDCINRIENLVGMSGIAISPQSLKYQISSAVQLIVQLERMRDGGRRITSIAEVAGIENGDIVINTLFSFVPGPMRENGVLSGCFKCHRIEPKFATQLSYFGFSEVLQRTLNAEDYHV
jgi:pilus assembly protein CpaF